MKWDNGDVIAVIFIGILCFFVLINIFLNYVLITLGHAKKNLALVSYIWGLVVVLFLIFTSTLLLEERGHIVIPLGDKNSIISNLILIDSLITAATITVISLMNHAADSSGSSQFQRKMFWHPFVVNDRVKTGKFGFWVSFFTPLMLGPIGAMLIVSILLTMLSGLLMLLPIGVHELIAFLFSSAMLSGFILISIIVKYVVFNKNSYNISASIFISLLSIRSRRGMQSTEMFLTTKYKMLHGTKNTALLIEIIRELRKSQGLVKNEATIKAIREKNMYFITISDIVSALHKIHLYCLLHNADKHNFQDYQKYIKGSSEQLNPIDNNAYFSKKCITDEGEFDKVLKHIQNKYPEDFRCGKYKF